jgi:RNA polymerase sigma factor (sigma-70 family)
VTPCAVTGIEEARLDENQPTVGSLAAAAADGDGDAWAQIVDRFAPLVMAVLAGYRIFGADAQDVSQIVWLRLVEHLGDLREPRALPGWLVTTARNECVRLLRARTRLVPCDPQTGDLDGEVEVADPADRMLRAERVEAFLEALGDLSDRDRALLLLLAEDPPLPYAEISRRMGIPVGSIGPTRLRLLRKLRSSPALVALFGPHPDTDGRGGGQHDVRAVAG